MCEYEREEAWSRIGWRGVEGGGGGGGDRERERRRHNTQYYYYNYIEPIETIMVMTNEFYNLGDNF